jgi:hypothetical protein
LAISFDDYIKKFDSKASKYIPPKKDWTPSDYATYGVKDLYRIPVKEANELRFKSIKYQFKRHFELNSTYNGFCKEKKVTPQDIKTLKDLEKIPLIPGEFYKNYPSGRDFALWLSNIFTGEIPQIKIKGKEPTYDDVINAFNSSGMAVSYSSGTSGRHTFIPRDRRTFNTAEYLLGKVGVTMMYPMWDPSMHGYLLMPNPFKTNVMAGRAAEIYYDLVEDVKAAIDREINTEIIRKTMISATQKGVKAAIFSYAKERMYNKMIKDIIDWLEKHQKQKTTIALVGAPFILYVVMKTLKEQGKTFNFSGKGGIITGGGWKIQESKRMPAEEFRVLAKEILGIEPEHCLDGYGMVESNGWMIHCPEGHYFHIPHSYYHTMVLDEEFKPMGYNEYGRFAFLDGSTDSYPGFMITGDRVKMLEHCPVCDRPGPVFEPEVTRVVGKEMRGCAEEVRKMMSSDLGSD